MNDNIKLRWQKALKERKFVWFLIASLAMFILLMAFLAEFQSSIELRDGVIFKDPLFGNIPPVSVDWILFFTIYSVQLVAILYAFTRPENTIQIIIGYFFVYFFRIFALYLLPLEPPENTIPLYDPILIWFGKGEIITKDLFYSGHTATTFMVFLITENKKLKFIIGIGLIITMFGVLLQRLHYSVDVYVALFFAYTAYRLSKILVSKMNFKFYNKIIK